MAGFEPSIEGVPQSRLKQGEQKWLFRNQVKPRIDQVSSSNAALVGVRFPIRARSRSKKATDRCRPPKSQGGLGSETQVGAPETGPRNTRWNKSGQGTLSPCPGRTLACELPSTHGVPLARWSQAELARYVQETGLVGTVSGSTIWRWALQGRDSSLAASVLALSPRLPLRSEGRTRPRSVPAVLGRPTPPRRRVRHLGGPDSRPAPQPTGLLVLKRASHPLHSGSIPTPSGTSPQSLHRPGNVHRDCRMETFERPRLGVRGQGRAVKQLQPEARRPVTGMLRISASG